MTDQSITPPATAETSLPCLWCGAVPFVPKKGFPGDWPQVVCRECQASGPEGETVAAAVAAWNKWAAPAPSPDAVAAELDVSGPSAAGAKSPLEDAIDLIWRDVILSRKPAYGDWEYGGMAYRHVVAEVREIEADRDRWKAAAEASRAELDAVGDAMHRHGEAYWNGTGYDTTAGVFERVILRESAARAEADRLRDCLRREQDNDGAYARLEQALRFYADPAHWSAGGVCYEKVGTRGIRDDYGKVARDALAGTVPAAGPA